jgi:hypothetical protein
MPARRVDDALYSAESYGHGSVWPLGTGIQAMVFYRFQRPAEGEKLVRAMLQQSFLN